MADNLKLRQFRFIDNNTKEKLPHFNENVNKTRFVFLLASKNIPAARKCYEGQWKSIVVREERTATCGVLTPFDRKKGFTITYIEIRLFITPAEYSSSPSDVNGRIIFGAKAGVERKAQKLVSSPLAPAKSAWKMKRFNDSIFSCW